MARSRRSNFGIDAASASIPAIFPAYVPVGITASGGAWNAAIVAEVVRYRRTTLTATGLGAYIIALNRCSGGASSTLPKPATSL